MTISFVIPVYNEEKRIYKVITALLESSIPRGIKVGQVIFVNDGSTDKTLSILKRYEKRLKKKIQANIEIISYKQNRGKGYAVRLGMLASTADYALFFDADMSTPLSEVRKLIPFMQKRYDVLIGTRKNGKATVVRYQPIHRQLLGKAFTTLSNIFLGVRFTDFTCGFKAFSKKARNHVFGESTINRWGYDAEILYLSAKFKYRLCEIPVLWANDDKSKVAIFKDIFSTLIELAKIRFNDFSGNYSRSIITRPVLDVGIRVN